MKGPATEVGVSPGVTLDSFMNIKLDPATPSVLCTATNGVFWYCTASTMESHLETTSLLNTRNMAAAAVAVAVSAA